MSEKAKQGGRHQALVARGLAGKLDGFAAWNTNANTNGTALAVAIAAAIQEFQNYPEQSAKCFFSGLLQALAVAIPGILEIEVLAATIAAFLGLLVAPNLPDCPD